jgi:hypothetical protein
MIKVTADDIHKAHNNVFINVFSDPENVKVLLKMSLPEPIKNAIAKRAKLNGNGSCDKGFQRLAKYQGENVPHPGSFMENCS